MTEINIFEQATRTKLRFKATNGMVSTEDLWDLSLQHLDLIAKGIRKDLRESEDSFIDDSKVDKLLELRFDIIKHVITNKIAERDAKTQQRANAARRQQILEILESKRSDSLKNMSEQDLLKELETLS